MKDIQSTMRKKEKTKERDKKKLKKFNRKEESNKTGNCLIKEEDKLERKKTMNDGMNKAAKIGVVRYTLLFSLSSQNQTFVFFFIVSDADALNVSCARKNNKTNGCNCV